MVNLLGENVISQQQFLMELFYPNTWFSILFSSIWHRFRLQAKKIQVHQGRNVLRFFLEAPSLQRDSPLAQKRGAYFWFKFLSVISIINNYYRCIILSWKYKTTPSYKWSPKKCAFLWPGSLTWHFLWPSKVVIKLLTLYNDYTSILAFGTKRVTTF